VRQVKLLSS